MALTNNQERPISRLEQILSALLEVEEALVLILAVQGFFDQLERTRMLPFDDIHVGAELGQPGELAVSIQHNLENPIKVIREQLHQLAIAVVSGTTYRHQLPSGTLGWRIDPNIMPDNFLAAHLMGATDPEVATLFSLTDLAPERIASVLSQEQLSQLVLDEDFYRLVGGDRLMQNPNIQELVVSDQSTSEAPNAHIWWKDIPWNKEVIYRLTKELGSLGRYEAIVPQGATMIPMPSYPKLFEVLDLTSYRHFYVLDSAQAMKAIPTIGLPVLTVRRFDLAHRNSQSMLSELNLLLIRSDFRVELVEAPRFDRIKDVWSCLVAVWDDLSETNFKQGLITQEELKRALDLRTLHRLQELKDGCQTRSTIPLLELI